jgi:PAS domain S-box-containing protein
MYIGEKLPAFYSVSMVNQSSVNPYSTITSSDSDLGADTGQVIREKLLLREAQLSQAQRMAGMASWEWYFGDTQIRWSPEMYLFWGYEPNEITVDLESVAQSTHLDDLPILQEAIGRALQGEDVEMEYRRYDKIGREIFIHTIGRIMHNEAGNPIGVFGIDLNITKRKEQENHLRQLNETLEQRNRELEQRNAELSAFSYVASHDLQEPLRKIQSFNSLILAEEAPNLSEQGKGYFNRTISAAQRMQALIKDLIDYSRVNAAVQQVELTELSQILRQVEQDLGELIAQKQASIKSAHLPAVRVVPFMFLQLFQNIISNSLKYQRANVPPSVLIEYQRLPKSAGSEQMHQLTFSDNGIGFKPQYNQRIFGLFQRLHGRSEYDGTGIGLAICHRIMQHHHGTIRAEGRPGQGSTFIVEWPIF